MTAIQFTRYRVLALVNEVGYTLDLVRDPSVAHARYETGGHRAAALYKGTDTLMLAVERAGVDGHTVPGSRRELARRSLLGPGKPASQGHHRAGQVPRRRRSRRRRTGDRRQDGSRSLTSA
jgi:hypothetical protein